MKRFLLISLLGLLTSCTSTPTQQQTLSHLDVGLGLDYLNNQQNDLAKTKLLEAVTLNPDSAEAYAALGYYYLQVDDHANALLNYNKALALAPKNPDMQNAYGVFLCRAGEPEDSLVYFLQAANNPNYTHTAEAYLNASSCAKKAGESKLANTYLTRAKQEASAIESQS